MNANLEKTIDKLQLEELIAAQSKIRELIEQQTVGKRQDLTEQFRQIAANAGLTIKKIIWLDENKTKMGRKGPKKSRPMKYRHPSEAGRGWSGVGKRPQWFKDWLDAGKDRDELLVNRA